MARRVLPFLVALAACNRGDDVEPVEIPSCGDDATVLGEQGAFSVQSVDFTFSWGNNAGVSVGPAMTFAVPADVTSISATVDVPGAEVGFALWQLGDDVWIDATRNDGSAGAWWSAPYFHWGSEGGTVAMPITPSTQPYEGCLVIQPAALQDLTGDSGTLRVVSRRYEPENGGVVDVNAVFVGDSSLSDADLNAAAARMGEVWSGGGGPGLGTVRRFTIDGNAYPRYAKANDIRSTPVSGAPAQAINLFFIQDFSDEWGTLGEAGGIPGPLGVQGVDADGVIVAIDGHLRFSGAVDTRLLGETMAHEIGHQMGLFHTTESDGSRLEALDDTPACPRSADNGDGEYTAEECADYDGANFMFWVSGSFAQDQVSASQALVIADSTITR